MSDRSRITLFHESGTYGQVSGIGFWPGLVQSHEPEESQNFQQIKFAGAQSRGVGQVVNGPLDFKGTIVYHPQDWRMLAFVLGSVANAGSPTPFTHTAVPIAGPDGNRYTSGVENPFISFQFEDHRFASGTNQNYARRYTGVVVDSLDIDISAGEVVTNTLNYIALSGVRGSGVAVIGSQPTVASYIRPYLWSDFSFNLPSGTRWNQSRGGKIHFGNNFDAPHYVGSRIIGTPIRQGFDTSVTWTFDAETGVIGSMYDIYFRGGSEFNCIINGDIINGSRDIAFTFSGCRVLEMTDPLKLEGVDTMEVTFVPGSANVTIFSNDENQYWAFGSP